MFKYWLFRRALPATIFAVLLGVITSVGFAEPYVKNEGLNQLNNSTYKDCKIDYEIPAPTKEQLEDIKSLDHIENVFGMYTTVDYLNFNGKNIKTTFVFSDCMQSIEMTMYNSKRLIKSNDDVDNPIYVDYDYQKKNNLNLGDEITYKNIKFEVARIYQTNVYMKDTVIAPLIGEQEDLILSKVKSYSSAFIQSNNFSETTNYLRTYKPLGRLRDRSEFDTEEEYQAHYNGWFNHDYFINCYDFNNQRANVVESQVPNYIVGPIICALLLLIGNASYFLIKKQNIYFRKLKDKKGVIAYYLGSPIFEGCLGIVATVVASFIVISNVSYFINPNLASSILLANGLILLSSLIINTIINIIFYKFYIKKFSD